MSYIYNLLLLHIMNLNGVVGAAYPRVLNYYFVEYLPRKGGYD